MDKFCNVIYLLFIIFNIVNEINMVIQNFIITSDDVFYTLTIEHVLDIYRIIIIIIFETRHIMFATE